MKRFRQFNFARKTLKKKSTKEINWKMERDNLRIFTEQRHDNIIQALFFYEWRDHMNFVFPFIEGNLGRLLEEEWYPLNVPKSIDGRGMSPRAVFAKYPSPSRAAKRAMKVPKTLLR